MYLKHFRRFPKRLYVQLPDTATRKVLLKKLLSKHNNPLNNQELDKLSELTQGYSSSDLTALAKDSALGPIRGSIHHQYIFCTSNASFGNVHNTELGLDKVKNMDPLSIRPIAMRDFMDSLKRVRHSVSTSTLAAYEKWNREYGDVSI